MYFPLFQLYKNFSTLPRKLHEQQIFYTFTDFYHHCDQLLALYKDSIKYDSTVQVSSV